MLSVREWKGSQKEEGKRGRRGDVLKQQKTDLLLQLLLGGELLGRQRARRCVALSETNQNKTRERQRKGHFRTAAVEYPTGGRSLEDVFSCTLTANVMIAACSVCALILSQACGFSMSDWKKSKVLQGNQRTSGESD